MNKVSWKEISESGQLKIKNKSFSKANSLRNFVKNLFKKTEFLEIVSYCEE